MTPGCEKEASDWPDEGNLRADWSVDGMAAACLTEGASDHLPRDEN